MFLRAPGLIVLLSPPRTGPSSTTRTGARAAGRLQPRLAAQRRRLGRPDVLPRVERLSACIAHDRRGHGRSSQPWNGNDMDTYADDLAELIEALDLRDVDPGRPLDRRRRGRPLHRPPRHRAGGEGRARRRDPAADAEDRGQSRAELPIEVFDEIRAGVSPTARSSTRISRPVLRREPRRRERLRGRPRRVLAARACRPGSRAPTTASRRSRRPTSPRI